MNKKVLVVDDDAMIRATLTIVLERHRLDSDTAQDADGALALIQSTRYDVVVTDYQMPGMSGLELIDIVRVKSPSSAVILMSGCIDETLFQRSGADYYLKKPFTAEVFADSIQRALQGRLQTP
jgi:DNA-binding response OmpR family regulator